VIPIMTLAERLRPAWAVCGITLAIVLMLPVGGDAALGDVPEIADAAGLEARVAFPLTVRPGQRYLEDAVGRPFLIHGDAAWSLIVQLTREEVELYLDDRRARGFNTILVELIEARFAANPPANVYGHQPFRGQPFGALASLANFLPSQMAPYGARFVTRFADFSQPNEAYFSHVDWVLRRAAERGFLVILAPSFVGWGGGSQGWYSAMVANGPDRLRQYGEYLGRRYRDFENILWLHGGDDNPPRKDLVRAIAEGIAKFSPRSLHTAHGAPETAAIQYWAGEAWIGVNNIYTYEPVYAVALEQYARHERMPFFLLESAYENEHDTTEQRLRTQAYQAILSGAAGQIFGNNPIWHFGGPGLFPARMSWQEALGSPGARSMTHLRRLLASLPWWLLEPDADHTLLINGRGPEQERAVAARAADRSLALVYLPSRRGITVDLEQLAGPQIAAHWYDPSDGRISMVRGAPYPAIGTEEFTPEPGSNGSRFSDWVLILESVT
jgi:hypothetical protein